MNFINDILNFLNTLTFIDYVFFIAVLILFMLIICLLYFIKINENVVNSNNISSKPKSELELINEALKNAPKKTEVIYSDFEREQEENAIISIDELIKNNVPSENYNINYSEVHNDDGLTIKKVNMNDMLTEIKDTTNSDNKYSHEEVFLNNIKQYKTN